MLSKAPVEGIMIIMYISGGLVQLYILCSCVNQLLDAVSFILIFIDIFVIILSILQYALFRNNFKKVLNYNITFDRN